MAVTLIQSNASGYGSGVVEPNTGVFLHNRGLGFSLLEGHPAELAAGRRPPHTLSPMIVTRPDGSAAMAIGTMGGDSQPQILLQLLVRLLVHQEPAARAVAAGRFTLVPRDGGNGFETWTSGGVSVKVEGHAPDAWIEGLRARGHHVTPGPSFDHGAGHAHLVAIADTCLIGAADPRSRSGAAGGFERALSGGVRRGPGEQVVDPAGVDNVRRIDAALDGAVTAVGLPVELPGSVRIGVDRHEHPLVDRCS